MNKRYTHIFFDLDNTLWDFTSNSQRAMEITFNQLCRDKTDCEFVDFFEVYQENNHKLWAAYRQKELKKRELVRQRFQLTFDALHINGVDAMEMNSLYLAEMPKQTGLIEGTLELLDYLKVKGYKLYIITNGFIEVQHKKLQNSGLVTYFEKVFISEELKCPKPGRAIFEHAIKSANAKKANSLMVGDDWSGDVTGAINFGIDVVYFNPGNDTDSKSAQSACDKFSNVDEISSLRELKALL